MARVQREMWRKRNQYRIVYDRVELAALGFCLLALLSGLVALVAGFIK